MEIPDASPPGASPPGASLPDARLRRIEDQLSSQAENRGDPEPIDGHTEAAVALILRASAELEILLIKRAESERDPWSGHVALPGGRRDPEDPNLTRTAIRETSEETGVELSASGWPLGRLQRVVPSHPTLPPITITPYVFGVPETIEANADSVEVDQVLWVTLPVLLDPKTRGTTTILLPEGPADFPCYWVDEHAIWGLTFRILSEFGELARGL